MSTEAHAAMDRRFKEVCRARNFSERVWLSLAGMSHGVLSIHRARRKTDPDATLEMSTFQALARAAKVHEEWLRTGIGPRDLPDAPRGVAEESAVYGRSASVAAREAAAASESAPQTITLMLERGRVPELRFGNLVGWGAWLAEARVLRPDYGDEVWAAVSEMHLFLPGAPSSVVVACAADIVAGLRSPARS